jgi:Beta-lactamase enzyme family
MVLSAVLPAPGTGRGWRQDPALAVLGRHVIKAAAGRFPEARPGDLALSLVLPGEGEAAGFSHRGDRMGYPASLVKLFFMVFAQAQLEAGRLGNSRKVRQALQAMIRSSSNDATSHIVDILTGTTSGPALAPAAFARWLRRRQAVNRFFAGWRWPELAGINLVQKTWQDAPFGREHQSCYAVKDNRNRLSSDALARLLLAIGRGEAVSPGRSRAMMRLMERCPARIDPANPWDQMTGFLGEGLPPGARLWSKAGWSSRTRHDAAIVALAEGRRFILAVMTFGEALAANRRLLPFIARQVARGVARL